MIETLREPDSGEILLNGLHGRKDARSIKEIIGVQLQTTVFFDNLTVRETWTSSPRSTRNTWKPFRSWSWWV